MRYSDTHKEETRNKVVRAAAVAVRAKGPEGVGVAEIMAEAGLTHGGFYAHFASREAMLAEAADRAGAEGVAALCSETPRQAPEVRRAATRRIKEMIDLVARQSPDWGQTGAHERALVTVATAVGALVLARAVDDTKLSDAVRTAALNHLTPKS